MLARRFTKIGEPKQKIRAMMRLRSRLGAICGLVALTFFQALSLHGGPAFTGLLRVSASSIARHAAGDDFDFGDIPSGSKPPKSAPAQAVTSRAGSSEDDDDNDYFDDDDDEEYQRDEPDMGSVAPFVSFALLALGSIGFIAFQVSAQNQAFSGSQNAPKIQKVQAAYSTYFADGEAPTPVS
ncbi:hypothetical protein AK812_SmicGene35114 [Symbiodinium microadriaticum]|uniref:Transmembrane protein n=1 Tax=Symbiodinium microadriaticum TaxID=2951 RepID=A0A1Q9CMB2_SYMMI|nr:hypothetical protein AK812_SmicGene35114 [Symbiodinium microadriaticum]